jgi:hypothetical protein
VTTEMVTETVPVRKQRAVVESEEIDEHPDRIGTEVKARCDPARQIARSCRSDRVLRKFVGAHSSK